MDKQQPVSHLMRCLDRDPLIVNRIVMEHGCQALWDWCRTHQFLVPTSPREWTLCPDCWEASDVVSLPSPKADESPSFYISCEECGPAPLDAEELKQWVFDVPRFLETIFRDVPRAGSSGGMIPGRWWRLGRTRWAGTHWNLHFARKGRREISLSEVDLPLRSVVFAPTLPRVEAGTRPQSVVVIPLDQILIWDNSDLLFDHEFVEDQLQAVSLSSRKRKSVPTKAGQRQAKIKALERVLTQHLISARDFAVTTRDRTGSPQLLKRPTIERLSQEVGFSGATVWRCLNEAKHERLGQLWELADDVERILDFYDRHC